MMSGALLARSQKLAVQHYILEVQNLFTKASFPMIASDVKYFFIIWPQGNINEIRNLNHRGSPVPKTT